MTASRRIIETCFRVILILVTNILILLSILRNIIKYGKEYIESPTWISMPKFLDDPKYGQHKIAHLKDINIHYVESGDPDKPLMLFVHGFPEFWYSWHHQIVEFQKDFRVVALDLRGYGYSDKPQDVASYSADILVEDLRQLIQYLGVSKCTLVGHDWGGSLTWRFSQQHPEFITRTIVMNCPHTKAFQDVLAKSRKQLLCSWYIFFFQMPWLPEWYLRRLDLAFIAQTFTGGKMGLKKRKLSTEEVKAYKANMIQPGTLTGSVNFYRAVFRHPPASGTGILDVPVLLIWGTEDGALTIDLPKACEKYCRDLTVKYMDGSSHWVQQDMPVEVNAAMREFIAQK